MATLTPQVPSLAGLSPSFAAASAGGDKVAPDERTWLHVKNASGGSVNVTLTGYGAIRGQVVANVVVAVPAAGERLIGPLTADLFTNPADGLVNIGYSAVTSVTVAAFRI